MNLSKKSNKIALTNPITNVYGFARTIIAFGTFSTLLANSTTNLFPKMIIGADPVFKGIKRISIFSLFQESHLEIAKLICLISLIVVMSGWRPRLTGLIHWWISWSFWISVSAVDGGDQIASNLTLLLLPITLFDSRIWHWSVKDSPFFNNSGTGKKIISLCLHFCYWLVQIQMSFIYLNAAIAKFAVPEWINGTAVYYWFTHDIFGVPLEFIKIVIYVFSIPIIVVVFSWGTVFLELILSTGMLLRYKIKKILLPIGVLFHFMIILFHGLFSFFFSMTGGLILFLRPVNKRFYFLSSIKYTAKKI